MTVFQIGDMASENVNTEWAVMQLSNEYKAIVTLVPLTITRSLKNCSLKISSSSNLTK